MFVRVCMLTYIICLCIICFIVFISLNHSKDKRIFCVFIFNVKQIDFTCSEMCCMNKIAFGVTIKIHLSDLEETLENEQIKS